MTRFGFFLFNILLVTVIYGLGYMSHAKGAAHYMLINFSIPYCLLLLLMTLYATVRWFMHHDPDVGTEIATWANAMWFVPAITAGALYLVGGIDPAMMAKLRHMLVLW